MAIFPRPVSPRGAVGDLWNYLVERRAHKWPLLGLSAALTWLIIWAFMVDANTNTMPGRNKIYYFQSWDANRSDAAIIMQQKLDLAEAEAAMRKKQREMQKVADAFGIEWREEAQRNGARHAKALKRVEDMLDARLAKAQAKEGKLSDTPVDALRSESESAAPPSPAKTQ